MLEFDQEIVADAHNADIDDAHVGVDKVLNRSLTAAPSSMMVSSKESNAEQIAVGAKGSRQRILAKPALETIVRRVAVSASS